MSDSRHGRSVSPAQIETARAIKRDLIRHEYRAGEFRENLAKRHGVSRSVVDGIATGRTYWWIDTEGA